MNKIFLKKKIMSTFLKFTVLINLLHHCLSIPSLAAGHLNYFPFFFCNHKQSCNEYGIHSVVCI